MALIGTGMGLIGASLIGTSIYLNANEGLSAGSPDLSDDSVSYTVQPNEVSTSDDGRLRLATLTPTPSIVETVSQSTDLPSATATPITTPTPTPTNIPVDRTETTQPTPTPTQIEVAETPITDTVALTNTEVLTTVIEQTVLSNTETISSTDDALDSADQTEENVNYVEPYTSTNQVKPPPSVDPTSEAEVNLACPLESGVGFDLIPIEGSPMADHPDFLHGDLNLSLRGYNPISETLTLVYYNGDTDSSAPRLHGLFEPNRVAQISSVYGVNEWIWDVGQCGGNARGCRGTPIDVFWPVTLVGVATTPGEPIYIPERGPEIHPGGYIAMVLYAEEQRITLGYTRRDNAATGYIVHLEGVCVDPNLLALYQAQKSPDGWRTSGFLPALPNNKALGVALSQEIKVAVRDDGSFMDPRSEKDWWQ